MMPFIWLGIAVVLAFIEAAAPALVCVWFCVGAAAALVTSIFVTDLLVQIIVFLVVSLVALIALRPFIKKRVNVRGDEVATNSDAYIGRDVVVTQNIPEGRQGRVRLGDVSWSARSSSGEAITAGTLAKVDAVDGTVLVVEPVS